MPAIITENFKRQILFSLQDNFLDSANNNYYMAIGRSIDWNETDTTPQPARTEKGTRSAGIESTSIKKIAAVSLVVPRVIWSVGSLYSGYDDSLESHPATPYYTITDENQVYVCVQPARNAQGQTTVSTVKPTGTSFTPFATADGYVWKFLYSIGALRAKQFMGANYMPVAYYDTFDENDAADIVEQVGIHDVAVPKQILGYKIINGGTGYTSVPTLTVKGDGTGAQASATISGGSITRVEVPENAGAYYLGTNYNVAYVEVTGGGGTGAIIQPIYGPANGLGFDPRVDLRASAIMFHSAPNGDESGNWVIDNDFRRVSLVKNPYQYGTTSLFTAETGTTLKKLNLVSISSNFTVDKVIVGSTSNAQAYIVKIDGNDIYYVQNEDSGFGVFTDGETVTEINGIGEGILNSPSLTNPEVDLLTGDILFIDNRTAVTRSADQEEDIKIIIQL